MKWTTWSHPRLSKSKRIYVSWWLVHIYLNLLKDLNLLNFLEYLTFHTDHLSRLRWPPGALFCAGGKADQRSMATGGFVRQYRGILVGFWLDLHHEIRWWRLRESRPFVPLRWKSIWAESGAHPTTKRVLHVQLTERGWTPTACVIGTRSWKWLWKLCHGSMVHVCMPQNHPTKKWLALFWPKK